MTRLSRRSAAVAAVLAGFGLAARSRAADKKEHRVVFHVDQNDPALMNLTLNNVSNLLEYYQSKGEQAQVEVVAYGPGLNMLREDKSPVKDRIARMKGGSFPSSVAFSACGNTKRGMEKAEGHSVPIIPQATVVPAGVVRLTELQEQGWTYLRP
jgi:intracellular sulfur oxidation DsrE/DsrF family protein